MTSFARVDPSQVIGLLLALGIGLLIGLERERRKGEGPDRRASGIRSFALVAVSGALAQLLPEPGLVAVGGLLVASLAAISHFKSRSGDPGFTTELALFVTYLVGVLVANEPLLGTACGVALALLLNTRTRLHRFATQVFTEQELHDGLLLSCAGLLALAPADSENDRESPLGQREAIRIREAIALASMLFVITLTVSYAQRRFGQAGLMASVAVTGLADAHSSVASLAALFAGGRLPRADLILGVLLAITANSGTRLVVALAAGGWANGLRVGAALASGLAGAWTAWAWWP